MLLRLKSDSCVMCWCASLWEEALDAQHPMTSAQNVISDIIASIANETGAILMDVHKVRQEVVT
jgi:hypothetical protein